MRGWSHLGRDWNMGWNICPAYAGVILFKMLMQRFRMNFSRVCRGDFLGRIAGTSIIHFLEGSKRTYTDWLAEHERRERRLFVVKRVQRLWSYAETVPYGTNMCAQREKVQLLEERGWFRGFYNWVLSLPRVAWWVQGILWLLCFFKLRARI